MGILGGCGFEQQPPLVSCCPAGPTFSCLRSLRPRACCCAGVSFSFSIKLELNFGFSFFPPSLYNREINCNHEGYSLFPPNYSVCSEGTVDFPVNLKGDLFILPSYDKFEDVSL